MLTVATTCTAGYGKPWVFPTLGLLSCRVACLLDPSDPRPLPANARRYPYQTPGVMHQDGRFLEALPDLSEEDLVVLADADAVFQRDFEADELQAINDLGRSGFALGYNLRPGQTGGEEYRLLRPRMPPEEAAALLSVSPDILLSCWVYNTGFVAARVGAWRRLRELFASDYGHALDRLPSLFALHSWPQLLICLTLFRHGLPVTELPYSAHSHGHFPLTALHKVSGRRLYHGGREVLYAHNLPDVVR